MVRMPTYDGRTGQRESAKVGESSLSACQFFNIYFLEWIARACERVSSGCGRSVRPFFAAAHATDELTRRVASHVTPTSDVLAMRSFVARAPVGLSASLGGDFLPGESFERVTAV